LTIQAAVDLSSSDAEIRVAAGTYTRGSGLPDFGDYGIEIKSKSGFLLSGGWNSEFTEVTGTSTLLNEEETNDSSLRLIHCTDFMMSTIRGFTVGSGEFSAKGAGIYIVGDDNTIEDVAVMNCYTTIPLFSSSYGGGLYVQGDRNEIDAEISLNTAKHGAGVALVGNENVLHGSVFDNTAAYSLGREYGGGVFVDGSDNTIDATITGNTAHEGGGVYVDLDSTGNTISGEVSGNMAVYGGGVYVEGNQNTVSAAIFENSAEGDSIFGDLGSKVKGGGIYLEGDENLVSGSVYANICQFTSVSLLSLAPSTSGGGVYVAEGADGNEISAQVYENTSKTDVVSFFSAGASTLGGGICTRGSDTVISGSVFDNESRILGGLPTVYGGGIYIAGDGTTVTADVTDNSVDSVGLLGNTYGSGIAISCATDVTLSEIDITGNTNSGLLSASYALYLVSRTDDPITNLVIEKCTFGGTEDGGYAIVEKADSGSDPDVEPIYADITGQTLRDNLFDTSSLDHLYADYGGEILAADEDGLSILNTPDAESHDASTASGNTLIE